MDGDEWAGIENNYRKNKKARSDAEIWPQKDHNLRIFSQRAKVLLSDCEVSSNRETIAGEAS